MSPQRLMVLIRFILVVSMCLPIFGPTSALCPIVLALCGTLKADDNGPDTS